MDYAHTYPNVISRYHTSNMCLHLDSDVVYLIQHNTCSRGAGNFSLSNTYTSRSTKHTPTPSGAILTKCNISNNTVTSAVEAKVGAIFNNDRAIVPIIVSLQEMGHSQGPAYINTDNNTSYDFLTSTIHQKNSKAFEMRFHWVRDRIQQE